jgi:hypothetical protein
MLKYYLKGLPFAMYLSISGGVLYSMCLNSDNQNMPLNDKIKQSTLIILQSILIGIAYPIGFPFILISLYNYQ